MSDPAVPLEHIDRFCAACGYNLRGVTSDRCPECGTSFDPALSADSQIPWSHRRTIGSWRAFWRTVGLASFRPRTLAAEIHRPVSLADALAFRWRVSLIAMIVPLIAAIIGYCQFTGLNVTPWYRDDPYCSIAQWLGLAVLGFSVWLWIYFTTGVASYFFQPRRLPISQQDRATSLSYYACAPMVFWPLTGVAAAAFAFLTDGWIEPRGETMIAFALLSLIVGTIAVVQLLIIWRTPIALLRATTQPGALWRETFGIVLPVVQILLLTVTVGVINGAYWIFAIMLISLR